MDAIQDLVELHRTVSIGKALAGVPRGPGAVHCADCGDEIPPARRKAYPAARTCIDCQQIRERK